LAMHLVFTNLCGLKLLALKTYIEVVDC